MKNFKESKARANQDNNGMILSPLGNMYYMPEQKDPTLHDGDVLRLHGKIAWSANSEEISWPKEMQIQHYSKISSNDGVIALSYTKENYIFPKHIGGVKVEIREAAGMWNLYFKNLGSIMYLPELGLGVIRGHSNKKAKSIYKAVYNMYDVNGCIVKNNRSADERINLDQFFA